MKCAQQAANFRKDGIVSLAAQFKALEAAVTALIYIVSVGIYLLINRGSIICLKY